MDGCLLKNDHDSNKDIPNILIVDDIAENLKVLGDILKSEGFKVRPVLSGSLALQVAEKEKPDLVLLDIMMPGLDGFEVCRRLKENPELKNVPVIFISALTDTSDIVAALTAGGVDYITKPFQAAEVIARVRTQLTLYFQSRELLNLNATKDKFFSIIAHDLQSPINSFLGMTQMMAEEIKNLSPTEVEEMSRMLNKSASNLFGLLENLLQWSMMQRGITVFSPERFILKDKILNCIAIAFDATQNKDLQTDIHIPGNLEVFADIRMFETVMRNLYSNAVKFTPRGGKIFISVGMTENNFIEISVRDTGIGMNEDLAGRLFLPNGQTGRKGTDDEPSSGLGLILCKDFVERHGGKIGVKSEPEHGTTISFTVPYAGKSGKKPAGKSKARVEAKSATLKNLKILIAEDDEITGNLIAMALKNLDSHNFKAKTGVEAVRICRNHPDIDLVLMDIKMPEMDGYEATRQIRKFNSNVIIIAQTTSAMAGVRQKAVEAGCNGYVIKPYSQGLLTALIKLYLKKYRKRR